MPLSSDLATLGTDGFADSGGVKIHYVTTGAGPLAVLIHGIPGFWYDWRHQMPALARHFQVVAIDQRGFNLSAQPDGVENYKLDKLAGDVAAVVQHFGRHKAIIVGHDSRSKGDIPKSARDLSSIRFVSPLTPARCWRPCCPCSA